MRGNYHRIGGNGECVTIALDRAELNRLVSEELHRSALSIGVMVISDLLELEVRSKCGERRRRSNGRAAYRYGKQAGYVVLGGHKVRIERPRMRTMDGKREVEMEIYGRLQQREVIDETVLKRLVRGVTCRNYRAVIDTIRESVGVSRSSVSRAFIRSSEERVREFYGRRFEGTRFVAIFIDGVQFKRQTMLVAIGVDDRGNKKVLSVRQGASENARVCVDLLEELRLRGVRFDRTTLFVLDGSKALAAAVERVCGKRALIQRCRLHKMRNLRAYLSDELWPQVCAEMKRAYGENKYGDARRRLLTIARWLDRVAPAAARSLREGLEETLTVLHLRLPSKLRRFLTSTNMIESPFTRVRSITRRVTRWSGDMRIRWCVTALIEAEQRFIRISGSDLIRHLTTALDRLDQRAETMIA